MRKQQKISGVVLIFTEKINRFSGGPIQTSAVVCAASSTVLEATLSLETSFSFAAML
jgi:hypothetical protein